MIIYNVTTKVEWSAHDAWKEWMEKSHIPQIMDTGLFTHYKWVKLLELDDTDGPTYAIQYYASNRQLYDHYISRHDTELREKASQRWGDRIISFRTLMEVIN